MRALALPLFLLLAACSTPSDPAGSETEAPPATTGGSTSAPPSTLPGVTGPAAPQSNVILERPSGAIDTNPFVVAGKARTFENHVGIRVADASGTTIQTGFATATGELGSFNPFETEIFLTSDPGGRVTVTIFEESAKDGSIRSRDDATVPVTASMRTLPLHFPNMKRSGDDCTRTYPVERRLPASRSLARLAVEALVDGPTAAEAAAGASNPFPEGSAVRSVILRDGVITVDFNERLSNVGGSCRAQAIRAMVEGTLRGLDGIRSVRITAMGEEGTALQP